MFHKRKSYRLVFNFILAINIIHFYSSDSATGDARSSSASSSAPGELLLTLSPFTSFVLSVQNDSHNHSPLLFIELPGFYFDPEKNRYFRLLPGHNNCNPLTKEGLQKKEEEKKRSALLAEDDGPRKVSWGITEYVL